MKKLIEILKGLVTDGRKAMKEQLKEHGLRSVLACVCCVVFIIPMGVITIWSMLNFAALTVFDSITYEMVKPSATLFIKSGTVGVLYLLMCAMAFCVSFIIKPPKSHCLFSGMASIAPPLPEPRRAADSESICATEVLYRRLEAEEGLAFLRDHVETFVCMATEKAQLVGVDNFPQWIENAGKEWLKHIDMFISATPTDHLSVNIRADKLRRLEEKAALMDEIANDLAGNYHGLKDHEVADKYRAMVAKARAYYDESY